jgi:hypothetical protein
MPLRKATQAVISPNICTTDTTQTITGNKTFTNSIIGNVTGNLSGNVTGDVTGDVTGNVTGNVTGDVTGNVTGNAGGSASTLSTPRTIAISGAITGTATSFDGSSNISIPVTISSGATITSPIISGTVIGATGAQIPSTLIYGVTDGSSGASGFVGQVILSTIPVGNAVTLTSGVIANVTSISLPAGEWYINGQVNYKANSTASITNLTQGISQTTVQLGGQDTFTRLVMAAVVPTAASDIGIPIRGQRIVLTSSTPTPIYLVCSATFGGSTPTLSAYGTIEARRIR